MLPMLVVELVMVLGAVKGLGVGGTLSLYTILASQERNHRDRAISGTISQFFSPA